jgi:ATP-dependent helicase/nuclease subunit B
VERTGYEDAGIQILSALEARGLAFSRVLAPGLVAGVLPQPVRSLPLLSPEERKLVQGGSAESQFEFARSLLGHVYATAPEVVVSRPLMNRDGEPCLPSPFWDATREEKRNPVVPWRHDLPALQRAGWVVQGIEGMSGLGSGCTGEGASRRGISQDGDAACGEGPCRAAGGDVSDAFYCVRSLDPPSEVTVSELETILLCPSRFLFRNVLGLDVLPELVRGVAPSERGQVVHEIAAAFGRRILREPRLAEQPLGRLLDELRDATARALKDRVAIPWWGVEGRRLSGTGDEDAGLLGKWLEMECGRFADGWRWVAVERSFTGLKVGDSPITLRGRLDRLDVHPDMGAICWDYKTGRIPGAGELRDELRAPQLPAYVRAVEDGLVDESGKRPAPVGAGYIDLSLAGRLRHIMSFPPEDISDTFRERWEKEVSDALKEFAAGRLTPRWLAKEAGCDDPCPYTCLCGLALSAD